MYETVCTCPVCGSVFDVVRHRTKELNGQAASMLAGDGRRLHREASPSCAMSSLWLKGWNQRTRLYPIWDHTVERRGTLDAWITEQDTPELRVAIAFKNSNAVIHDGRGAVIKYGDDGEGNQVVIFIEIYDIADTGVPNHGAA